MQQVTRGWFLLFLREQQAGDTTAGTEVPLAQKDGIDVFAV